METILTSQKNHRNLRENAGYFFLDDFCLISAKGSDLFNYLQTQTTNDVNELKPGQGQNSAIVDKKAKIIATFSLHRTSKEAAVILLEVKQKENLLNHLESFLFREDVNLTLPEFFLLALQGPKSLKTIENFISDSKLIPEKPNDISQFEFNKKTALAINKFLTGEEGCVMAFPVKMKDAIAQKLEE
ncbi:uncharacterized protein METZ01_LOCUS226373, partial [marine metagenome]